VGQPRHNRHVRLGRPALQQTAPPACAQVRCIAVIYVENVGSQFLSLRHWPRISVLQFRLCSRLGLSCHRFREDLWTSPGVSCLLSFSNRPVFSEPLH
jgi:hypothetical protein